MADPGASGAARGLEFENFVLEIMQRSPDIELADIPVTPYDIQAWREGKTAPGGGKGYHSADIRAPAEPD